MRSRNSKSDAALPVVTQAALVKYVELSRLLRQHEQLRVLILESLESGSHVEIGPLTASVIRGQTRQLTASKVQAVLGERRLQLLRGEISPTPFRRLVVRENGWGATRRIPRPSGHDS